MNINSTPTEEKLFLNTLAFDYPEEPVLFYFAPTDYAETKGLTRLKSNTLYPDNIRDIFPNLKNGDAIYTSFDEYHEGLLELPIDYHNPQNANLIKRYYNYLIYLYFRRNTSLDVVANNLIRDNQFWVRRKNEDAEYPNAVKFDRFTLKVDYDHFNNHPQLVLSYDRPTHVSILSMAQIANRIPQDDPLAILNAPDIDAMVSKVLYMHNGRKIIDRLDYLRKRFADFDTAKAYPILSHSLRAYLNYPIKDNNIGNPLSRYFDKINAFYHEYIDNDDFRTYVPITNDGFSWTNEYQVFTTTYDS